MEKGAKVGDGGTIETCRDYRDLEHKMEKEAKARE